MVSVTFDQNTLSNCALGVTTDLSNLSIQLQKQKEHLRHVKPLPNIRPKDYSGLIGKKLELRSAADSFAYLQSLCFAGKLPKIPNARELIFQESQLNALQQTFDITPTETKKTNLDTPRELGLFNTHTKLAIRAVNYVRSCQFISLNREFDAVERMSTEYGLRRSFVLALRSFPGAASSNESARSVQYQASIQRIGLLSRTMKKEGLPLYGNCSEMAQLAFWRLTEQAKHPRLELMCLDNKEGARNIKPNIVDHDKIQSVFPDHVFLVIGRDPHSRADDSTTWGFNTVICDAWSGRVFSANQMHEEMGLIARVSAGETKTRLLLAMPPKG